MSTAYIHNPDGSVEEVELAPIHQPSPSGGIKSHKVCRRGWVHYFMLAHTDPRLVAATEEAIRKEGKR